MYVVIEYYSYGNFLNRNFNINKNNIKFYNKLENIIIKYSIEYKDYINYILKIKYSFSNNTYIILDITKILKNENIDKYKDLKVIKSKLKIYLLNKKLESIYK